MNTGVIQKILPTGDPKETGTLLVGFRTQFGNFEKLFSRSEAAVFLTVCDNVLRNGLADTGNIAQKGSRSGI